MNQHGQKVVAFMPNSFITLDDCPTIKAERFNWTLAYYYVIIGHRNLQNDSAGFIYTFDGGTGNYALSTNDTLCWWGYQALYDMGYPTDTAKVFGTNRGWIRHYDNGVAVLHPTYSSDNDSVQVSLGGTYYRVLNDGTLSDEPETSCWMKNAKYYQSSSSDCADTGAAFPISPCCGRGAIFGVAAGQDSLKQYPTNIDSSTSSVTMRDSVVTLYDPPTDKIVLLFSITSSIGSSVRYDSSNAFDVFDTAQFTVSGRGEDSTFYYWFEASDDGNYDTSSMRVIHTTSTPPSDTINQVITHSETTYTSFSIFDDIYTNIDPPCDSAVLWTNTSKTLSGASRKDIFTASDTGTLQATGLLSGVKYYFVCIAWDSVGVYSDTTAFDSVRTESQASQQDSFTIDYTGIYDATIYSAGAELNYGASTILEVGTGINRFLIKALGIGDSIAEGVIADSACFEIPLYYKNSIGVGEYVNIHWYKVSKDWGEGNNNGVTADEGECSWDSASAHYLDWQVNGCDGFTDRSLTAESDGIHPDSITIDYGMSLDTTIRLWISPATIAEWDTSSNYGIVIIMTSGSADGTHTAQFYSTENATEALRPKLIVYKSTPQQASVTKRVLIKKG